MTEKPTYEELEQEILEHRLTDRKLSDLNEIFNLLGSDPSFLIPDYQMYSNWEMAGYVILGMVAALSALAFVRFFYLSQDFFRLKLRRIPAYVIPALGGLVVGLIGVFYPLIFGVGYGRSYGPGGVLSDIGSGGADLALVGGELAFSMLLILLVLKAVATSATLGSGGSGGVFAPALFMGSMLGGAFGLAFNRMFPTVTGPAAETSGSFALVGMGAFFAAVVHGPMKGFTQHLPGIISTPGLSLWRMMVCWSAGRFSLPCRYPFSGFLDNPCL